MTRLRLLTEEECTLAAFKDFPAMDWAAEGFSSVARLALESVVEFLNECLSTSLKRSLFTSCLSPLDFVSSRRAAVSLAVLLEFRAPNCEGVSLRRSLCLYCVAISATTLLALVFFEL